MIYLNPTTISYLHALFLELKFHYNLNSNKNNIIYIELVELHHQPLVILLAKTDFISLTVYIVVLVHDIAWKHIKMFHPPNKKSEKNE